jgi:flagellar motor switch protein FliM
MEKVLNQEEIDAMVRAARGGSDGGTAAAKAAVVTLWDARQAGQIGSDQVRQISSLHEGFARNLTNSLAAYLRVTFSAALVSAEHLAYRELLQRIPETTYLACCRLSPLGTAALLQLDLSAAYPLIDILLGGEGIGAPPARPITGIEEQILETIMRIICRELQTAWQALAVEFEFEQQLQAEQVPKLMSADEKTLSISFEITMADSRGTLMLGVPAVVSNALLRRLSAVSTRPRPRLQPDSLPRLRARLVECLLRTELGTGKFSIPMGEMASMEPGSLLVFRQLVDQPARLRVGGSEMFYAAVARRGTVRVAQLQELCQRTTTEVARIAASESELGQ